MSRVARVPVVLARLVGVFSKGYLGVTSEWSSQSDLAEEEGVVLFHQFLAFFASASASVFSKPACMHQIGSGSGL